MGNLHKKEETLWPRRRKDSNATGHTLHLFSFLSADSHHISWAKQEAAAMTSCLRCPFTSDCGSRTSWHCTLSPVCGTDWYLSKCLASRRAAPLPSSPSTHSPISPGLPAVVEIWVAADSEKSYCCYRRQICQSGKSTGYREHILHCQLHEF